MSKAMMTQTYICGRRHTYSKDQTPHHGSYGAHRSAAAELLPPQQQRCLLVFVLLHGRVRLLEAQVRCLLAAALALGHAMRAVPGIRCAPDC